MAPQCCSFRAREPLSSADPREVRVCLNNAGKVRSPCAAVCLCQGGTERLAADIYYPNEGQCGQWPGLLTRAPWGRLYDPGWDWEARARAYPRAGFVVCIQDVRGAGDSEGELHPFLNEPADGYDSVEWLAAHEYCNGNVGMFGVSYGAWTQLQLAITNPPSLKTMVPMYDPINGYHDSFRDGGALQLWWIGMLASSAATRDDLSFALPDIDEALFDARCGGIRRAWASGRSPKSSCRIGDTTSSGGRLRSRWMST
jgi:predicted acyl esterase